MRGCLTQNLRPGTTSKLQTHPSLLSFSHGSHPKASAPCLPGWRGLAGVAPPSRGGSEAAGQPGLQKALPAHSRPQRPPWDFLPHAMGVTAEEAGPGPGPPLACAPSTQVTKLPAGIPRPAVAGAWATPLKPWGPWAQWAWLGSEASPSSEAQRVPVGRSSSSLLLQGWHQGGASLGLLGVQVGGGGGSAVHL